MKKTITAILAIYLLCVSSITGMKAEGSTGMKAEGSAIEEGKFLLWTEYETSPSILDIAVGETYIWGVHLEGVVRWHKQDQTYTTFTAADGLIDSYVNVVEIDNDGNVWFGTPSGLSRFDGNNWTHFTTANGLVNNFVLSLLAAPSGELLVGTGGGLSIFDGTNWVSHERWDFTIDPYGCLDYGIRDVEIDNNGYIWISTGTSPTCYFNGNRWDSITYNGESVSADEIAFDANGDLWLAGTYYQGDYVVMRYEANGIWHRYTTADGLLDDDARSVAVDGNGDVWVGDGGYFGGVSHFDGNTWTSSSRTEGYYGGGVSAVAVDEAGDIWTGGGNNVSRLHNNSWQAYLAGPPRGLTYDMTFDHNDHLWLSQDGNGVVKYDGQRWIQYTKANGLANDIVADIFSDTNGNMWFACYDEERIGKGISKFDGTSWESFTTSDGLTSNYVQDLTMDDEGALWIAYRSSSGVDKKTDTGWINYTTADGLLFDRSQAIYAQGNVVWTGYYGGYVFESGVSQFDSGTWNGYINELPYDEVREFTIAPNGNLLALSNYGVNEFDGTNWSGYAIPNAPGNYSASDFVLDNDGTLWIVRQQDLFAYDGNWNFYDQNNTPVGRLQSHIATNATGDEIWIDSQSGVVKLRVMDLAGQVFLPIVQK